MSTAQAGKECKQMKGGLQEAVRARKAAARQLRHPHILRLHAVFEDESYVFLVTEFAEVGRGRQQGRHCRRRRRSWLGRQLGAWPR